ncbi:MAG: T9SS type A sorting domain-containing protein, partial [Bacteroidetes bacterium]|nr:T9SS type A sorting domain-containing protein [Bacteroidota bacterium]
QRGSALIVAHHVTASVDEVSFTPVPADAVPPVITNVLTEVSATSAYITFDTDEPARASVSFGRSSSYDSLAMSDTLLRLTHGIPIVGLTPNTNYHFSIVVTDNAGNGIATADAMFTTLAPAAPTSLVTDEFNSTALHPRWAPVDPLGDATFATPDSVLTIALPGVISHELWVDGYHAPHVYQTANNTDVQIDVKWNSPITGTSTEYRTQGIVAEQDATNMIRFDYSSTALGTYMFAASFNNGFTRNKITIFVYSPANGATGTQPLYLRVIREGHLWSQWYSTDGTSWNLASRIRHPLALAGVSLFASNAGPNAPAFTSIVDYFRVNGQTTDVTETPAIPLAYRLEQNYPNPFNPSTTIRYGIPHAGRVTLSVYTVLGQHLADLINEEQKPGFYSVRFDGSRLASGVYFYRLKAGDFLATRQLLLLK